MRRHQTMIATTVAAVAALAIVAPASASGTNDKVQIGALAASAGAQPFSAASVGSVTFAGLTCSSSSVPSQASNNITNSPTINVLDLASIAKFTFSGCLRSSTAMSVVQNTTWKLHGVSGATNAATDVVSVHVDNVSATITSPVCQYTVTGIASGTYREDTKSLTVNQPASGSLTASNVSGCAGQVINGQALSWGGSYAVNVASNSVINIKP